MTIKLSSLAVDLTLEREGEWVEVKEWPGLNPVKPYEAVAVPGLAFLVRSTNFPAYVSARQKALEKLKADYPNDDVPQAVATRVDGELAVEHLLLGWRGLDVEYSAPAALEAATAEEHRALRSMVFWCAGRVGKKQVEFTESAAKN
jgi:hypothetical protein